MKSVLCFVLFSLSLISVIDYAFAETWKVQIPSGSSEPSSLIHYMPTEISVRPGDKVEWGNADAVSHTVTSGTLESGTTGMFDSGYLKPGDKFSWVFDKKDVGEIKYFCTIHPWMNGVVNVIDFAEGFQVYHNVGSGISDTPVDVAYKVQRNLVNIEVDPVRNMIIFNFVGKIDNDEFIVRLAEELIKNPQSVWINGIQTTDYELNSINGVTQLSVVLDSSAEQVKITGTEVVGKFNPKKHVLINQMFGILDKQFYNRGDEIIISGEIKNPVQIRQISLDIISPNNVTVYHQEIPLVESTKFSHTVSTGEVLRDFGEYTVKIVEPSAKSLFLHFNYGIEPRKHESPLKQMRLEIEPHSILCNEGFELLMKISNGNAVCLTESTAKSLIQRGWADYF